MKDLTIIIPLKSYNENVTKLLNRAIESCGDNKIILVGKDVYEFSNDKGKDIQVINMSQENSYQHNVNIAIDSVETKYFSVLEYDDIYSKKWFDNVEKEIEYDTNDTSAFLPLTMVAEYDEDENNTSRLLGYSNEAFWSSSFSEEIGCVDAESLENYLGFNVSGAVFKTNDFVSLGKLKESMKLVFWYEYLLRAIHEGKRIYVIPKIGYYHFVGRKDSMTYEYQETMTEKEADWWVELAKKEFYFKKDRNKVYTEE